MLLDLLPELFDNVTCYCSVSDLKNVALTNSRCNTMLQERLSHTVRVPSTLKNNKKILTTITYLNNKLLSLEHTRVLRLTGLTGLPQSCFRAISKLDKAVALQPKEASFWL